ncbi:unnamed protein product [Didymodactylos carnosus]|uniref:von Willebrand factor A domain-containing protein 7 n=1 Tax=Didymodactylos carnosus TaxID=1234261 RepID=A0A815Y7D0_9BILA|nr:unnamed protein product [Didymodactylos carnosus]CAF4429398.1 unnamed protein product [Didymodactylos carnosus]
MSSDDTTHYSMTECAVLEITTNYLSKIHNVTTLQNIMNINNAGQCNTKHIQDLINSQLKLLKIDPKRLSLSIKTIADSNTETDFKEMTNEPTHFDSETFNEGAQLISTKLEAAKISILNDKNYVLAQEIFGSLLHTIQDFYSHTNWIELGYNVPNNALGRNEILGNYAPKWLRTCINCEGDSCKTNIEPYVIENNFLTSGYFYLKTMGIPIEEKPFGKCSHGGLNDYTINTDATGGGINKDTFNSVHGHLHAKAAFVSYQATIQILNDFWLMLGDNAFGEFLGLSMSFVNVSSSSLIIVMDDTGSMSPYIEMAKQISIGIVDIHNQLEYKPINYILSPFNDPTYGPLTISDNPMAFTAQISKLIAHDGGDAPELYYHGVLEALKVCEYGSSMYTFTDAPAKDAYLKSEVIALATDKKVTITSFYATPGVRKQFAQSKSNSIGMMKVEDVIEDLANSNLASLTGGVTIGINPQALNTTADYIIQQLEGDKLKTIVLGKGYNTNFTFYIDATITVLYIKLSATTSLLSTNIKLIRPTGDLFIPIPVSQTAYLFMYTIPITSSDDIGQWTVVSDLARTHTIQLNGQSEASCISTLQQQIIGTSDLSFTPLTTHPISNQSDLFVLTVCESLTSNITDVHINVMDVNDGSKILMTLNSIRITSTGFLAKITIPDVEFRLSSTAELEDGTYVQRQEKQIISPTSISMTINNQPYFVLVNHTLSMNYTLFNRGEVPLQVTLVVKDSLELLTNVGITKRYNILNHSQINDTIDINTKFC